MSEDKAKLAIEARENLRDKLIIAAEAPSSLAEVLTAVATEVQQAVKQENAATLGYIAELEQRLSNQSRLS